MKEKYIIIKANEIRSMENQVNAAIEKGYQPSGGIAVSDEKDYISEKRQAVYYQAMVLTI